LIKNESAFCKRILFDQHWAMSPFGKNLLLWIEDRGVAGFFCLYPIAISQISRFHKNLAGPLSSLPKHFPLLQKPITAPRYFKRKLPKTEETLPVPPAPSCSFNAMIGWLIPPWPTRNIWFPRAESKNLLLAAILFCFCVQKLFPQMDCWRVAYCPMSEEEA
jgi:hypothetical protein